MWITSRSWNNIIEFYAKLVKEHGWQGEAMLNFVEEIAISQYVLNPSVTVLFPATSLDILLIAATERFLWKTEVLEIRYLPLTQSFQFDFWESPFVRQHWQQLASVANGFSTFEKFLHLKRWA